ncbi:uncharacterized protein LOC111137772 [Crassostrea virginica]|uniref:ATP synthase F(0) complex subunit e, mitochondrial n=1 Tax=Crassostrea virginica TaxID=6565 RepID=A0A8B8EYP5_CRAVI|nr:uncharacterized protein LOC111137772 [Crassostrea virginica]|mmetsp:Transcript_31678/g.50596  ORF Transcript_31678/g.50596 Transcript_31678/m.50596 type:complete len:101 (+) Transcript_31678:66-368(+)
MSFKYWRHAPMNNPGLRTARYFALACGIFYGFKRRREIQAYEEVYQEDQLRIKMALKRLDKEINWLKYYDEMNDLAYDIGVPNRVVQADRAEIPKFLHED